MFELKQKQMFEKGVVRFDLLALRLFPRTIGLKGLSLIVRKNSCHTRSPIGYTRVANAWALEILLACLLSTQGPAKSSRGQVKDDLRRRRVVKSSEHLAKAGQGQPEAFKTTQKGKHCSRDKRFEQSI